MAIFSRTFMEISPDNIIYWSRSPFILNATILFTWLVMVLIKGWPNILIGPDY